MFYTTIYYTLLMYQGVWLWGGYKKGYRTHTSFQ